MNTILKTAALLMALGWLAIPAQAQLSYYVDDHGNLVYTNDDAPRARKGSGEKAAPANAKPKGAPPADPKSTSAAASTNPDILHQLVRDTAAKHNVDPELVSAVITTESNWNSSAI